MGPVLHSFQNWAGCNKKENYRPTNLYKMNTGTKIHKKNTGKLNSTTYQKDYTP
jgi:hypothetical protein